MMQCLLSNRSCSPSFRPRVPRGSLLRCQSIQMYHHHPSPPPFGQNCLKWSVLPHFRLLLRVQSVFPFQRGRPLHSVQSLTFRKPLEIPAARFTISSSRAFLNVLLRSCCLRPRALIPLSHSGCARWLLLNVRLFSVPGVTLFLPCPWRVSLTPCHPLRAAANFFRDPSLRWVRSFGWPRHPATRCRPLCRFFSAPKRFTAASSVGTSSCNATDFISSGYISIFSG
jgi:hypothetical protein